MKIVECPHCVSKVAASVKGICPSCLKNVNDPAAENSELTTYRIRHRAELVSVCCDCGRETDRFVTVNRQISRNESHLDTSPIQVLVRAVMLPWLLLFRMFGPTRDVVSVRVPQCYVCRDNGKPQPTHVDSENLTMTFLVHRNFKSAQEKRA